jgi:hypothetical protein
MQQARRASLMVVSTTFGLLSASTVSAHIDLLEPEARAHGTAARGDTDIDENSSLKSGPCGQMVSGRSQRVATYAPGQTIQVRVREENAHVSYLRVSLDLDGEDFPRRTQVPAGPETQDEAAAAEAALGGEGLLAVYREDNDTPGFVHELDVTLPDQTCDNCTLQVLQFMYDDPAAPYYFQCADLVIADAGGMQDAGAAPQNGGAGSVGTGSPGTSGSFDGVAIGSAGSGDTASAPMTTPLGAGGTTAASGSPSAPSEGTPAPSGSAAVASESDGGSGGCSMLPQARGRQSTEAALFALLALALGFTRRRR